MMNDDDNDDDYDCLTKIMRIKVILLLKTYFLGTACMIQNNFLSCTFFFRTNEKDPALSIFIHHYASWDFGIQKQSSSQKPF